jgi:hypothetical protein
MKSKSSLHPAFRVWHVGVAFVLAIGAFSASSALAKAPFGQSGCQIHDEQGRCDVIVDFVASAADAFATTYPPGYPSVYPPGSFFHRPQVVNLVYSYAQQYGFKVGGMTSWVGISFSAFLFRDQIELLRDDPVVSLVSENAYSSFSPGPPGTTFPAPFVTGEVTEYVNFADFPNQPGGQFFYAAMDADRALLDSVPAWQRTGRGFKTAGTQSVCRIYGGSKGGPNTHFYSLNKTECDSLRTLPALTYEGQTFLATSPLVGANATERSCPAGMTEIYRLYNKAYVGGIKNKWESNHRYVSSLQDVASTEQLGWINEGVAFCQPT